MEKKKRIIRKKTIDDIDINKDKSRDDAIGKQAKFMGWVQEFTKKVVVVTFGIFIIANAFFLCIIFGQFMTTNEISYLDTFITEMHTTFREVIGGYIVKAAVENAIKIGGNYMANYMRTKTQLEREKLKLKYNIDDSSYDEESETIEADAE